MTSVSSSLVVEHLQKKGLEVIFLVDPVDEFAIQQLKGFMGKVFKSVLSVGAAELMRFQTSESGDDTLCLKEYVDRMKEGQNDIYYIVGGSIASISTSLFVVNLRGKGLEVIYMVDPSDTHVMLRLEGLVLYGKKLKSAMTAGLDNGHFGLRFTRMKTQPPPRAILEELQYTYKNDFEDDPDDDTVCPLCGFQADMGCKYSCPRVQGSVQTELKETAEANLGTKTLEAAATVPSFSGAPQDIATVVEDPSQVSSIHESASL